MSDDIDDIGRELDGCPELGRPDRLVDQLRAELRDRDDRIDRALACVEAWHRAWHGQAPRLDGLAAILRGEAEPCPFTDEDVTDEDVGEIADRQELDPVLLPADCWKHIIALAWNRLREKESG